MCKRKFAAAALATAFVCSIISPPVAYVTGIEKEIESSGFVFSEDEIISMVLDNLTSDPSALQFGYVSGEWTITALSRSGILATGNDLFDTYCKNVTDTVTELSTSVNMNGALNKFKSTENSRLIIALSAIGKDPSDLGGVDLLAPYDNFEWVVNQGINGAAFALIAFDTRGYETRDYDIRQKCIDYILERQLDDGGWAAAGEFADPDITAIVLQALSRYMSDPAVSEAVELGIAVLSDMQTDDGGFKAFGSENSNSTSQVIIACTALGIDPDKDERFIKNGRSVYDALLGYYSESSGLFSRFVGEDGDAMATEQSVLALISYRRFLCGETSLYSMEDVSHPYRAVCICRSDGVDVIPLSKMEIAVAVSDPVNADRLLYNDGSHETEFAYAGEISEKIGTLVYVALVDTDTEMSCLANPENYSILAEDKNFLLGDTDCNGILNAQDALMIIQLWMRRSKITDNMQLLAMDVNGDGRINIADAKAIESAFVSGTRLDFLEKAADLLEG